jgi:hypothetical protein
MSQRMIDQIFREGYVMEVQSGLWHRTRAEEALTGYAPLPFACAQTFIVDNVTAYLYAGTSQEVWTSTDFPNCAPPAPVVWMETRHPSSFLDAHGRRAWAGEYAWGALLASIEVSAFPEVLTQAAIAFAGADQARFSEARWAYQVFPFVQHHRTASVIGPLLAGIYLIDGAGQMLNHWVPSACHQPTCTCPRTQVTHGTVAAWWPLIPPHQGPPSADMRALSEDCLVMLYPFWLALSFLHCKNVTATRTDPCHPRGKRRPQDPCRRVHYKVLDIQPMQRLLQQERSRQRGDLRQALHIMRGHFKNYQAGSGLFGKHHGLYWWDQRLRGSSDHGIVVKDYAVQVPAAGALPPAAPPSPAGETRPRWPR